jgi:kumamolisin
MGIVSHGLMVNAAEPEHKEEQMSLHFSIEMPKQQQTELEEKVAKGEVVSPQELQKYGPTNSEVKTLTSWLKQQGFEIEQISNDGTSVYAKGTVDQIQKSLEVNMVRVTKDGITYTAAQNAPSLPSEVGKSVHAIIGLQPFRQAHKNFRKCIPSGGNRHYFNEGKLNQSRKTKAATKNNVRIKANTSRPATNIQNAPPYLVAEVLKAYDGDELEVSGKGQTIAILIDTFPEDQDLKDFWSKNNLGVTIRQIEKINVNNVPLPAPEGEETLDVQWSSGVAPGANIRIYASGSLKFVDLDKALDRIIEDLSNEPGLRQLSISLGLGETYMGGPGGEIATQHMKFLKLAAAGVNVFVSSGDAGSNPDESGHSSNGPIQVEYEASDTSVIGVGGTSLKIGATGTVLNENAWSGSGGGKSTIFPRPSWQVGTGVPTGNERLVPDVSLAADPNTGALVILNGKVVQIGGTSWSAPMWAGICALVNEARSKAHKPLLPFLNPLLYSLLGSGCFRDISKGSNGAYRSAQGYDLITGIGVPNIKALIEALTK